MNRENRGLSMKWNTTHNKMTELLSHTMIWINHKILCQINQRNQKKMRTETV